MRGRSFRTAGGRQSSVITLRLRPGGGSGLLGIGSGGGSPVGPAQPVCRVVDGPDNQRDEQALDLVAGERDQVVRAAVAGVFAGADDCEERVGELGEGDPAGPGHITADLVLIQSGQALRGLERLLDPPP